LDHRTPTDPDTVASTGELFTLVHDVSRLTKTYFDRVMERHGLTHAQWWMLVQISQHEGATQIELAAITEMGRAAAGELLARMEDHEWIERRADETDARRRRVYLGKRASSLMAPLSEESKVFFQATVHEVAPADLEPAIRTLNSIKTKLLAVV
jgi:MarR family transcriptional regulator, transcriptional regulator for hemolysin